MRARPVDDVQRGEDRAVGVDDDARAGAELGAVVAGALRRDRDQRRQRDLVCRGRVRGCLGGVLLGLGDAVLHGLVDVGGGDRAASGPRVSAKRADDEDAPRATTASERAPQHARRATAGARARSRRPPPGADRRPEASPAGPPLRAYVRSRAGDTGDRDSRPTLRFGPRAVALTASAAYRRRSRLRRLLGMDNVVSTVEELRALQLERMRWSLAPRLRERAALPGRLRRGGRAARRPARAGRPGALPLHRQGGPARQLPVRDVRGAARAGRAGARVERHDGQADRGGLHPRRHRHVGRGDGPLDRGGRRAAGRPAARRLRLRPVHRRAGRALRRRAARLHGRAGQRRDDRAAGAADPGLPAADHHGHPVLLPRDPRRDGGAGDRPEATPRSRSGSSGPSRGPSRCARRSSAAATSGPSTSTGCPR